MVTEHPTRMVEHSKSISPQPRSATYATESPCTWPSLRSENMVNLSGSPLPPSTESTTAAAVESFIPGTGGRKDIIRFCKTMCACALPREGGAMCNFARRREGGECDLELREQTSFVNRVRIGLDPWQSRIYPGARTHFWLPPSHISVNSSIL